MRKIDKIQGSDEWLEFRKTGIGASDIGAIMGLSPFKKAIDVYNDKKGLGKPQFSSNAMLRGTVYEEEAREKYNKANNTNFQPIVVQHDDFDYFYASLDGYDEASGEVLEIKTPTNKKLIYQASIGQIPDYYESQIQWQLFCTGAKTAIYLVYDPEGSEMHEIIVERDDERIEVLKGAAIDFWVNLTQGIAPEDPSEHISLDFPDFIDKFAEYATYARIKSDAEKKLKELKPFLIDLGDDGNWSAHGLKFTHSQGKTSYDYKAMETDGVDINKYKKEGVPFYKIGIVK